MIVKLLQAPIRLWHRFISPALPPMCRHHPCCSMYAVEALERHPLPRAIGLILWRLLRCNPFCAGGYDPVPPGNYQSLDTIQKDGVQP